MLRLIAATLVLSAAALARADGVDAYKDAPLQHRGWYVAHYEAELARVDAEAKRARGVAQKKALREARDKLAANDPVYLPFLSRGGEETIKTGRIGRFKTDDASFGGVERVKVFQVVDEGELLGEVTYGVVSQHRVPGTRIVRPQIDFKKGPLLMFRGIDTANVTDGKAVKIDGVFRVAGTETYETALGGSNTVFVLERVQDPTNPFDRRTGASDAEPLSGE